MALKKTQSQFIMDAIQIHGNQYDYSLVDYKTTRPKVKIICKQHGVFEMRPNDHLSSKQGCKRCWYASKLLTSEQYVNQCKQIHGELYDYSNTFFQKSTQPVEIVCKTHGPFTQLAQDHLYAKTKCPKCSSSACMTTEQFIAKATSIHNNLYDYNRVVYKTNNQKVEVVCKIHGLFYQTPTAHADQKQGCPSCRPTYFSNMSIQRLTFIERRDNILISHALNGGEFLVPTTKYRVDGLCKELNSIYEFHGNCFHGNPRMFKPTDYCNPFNKRLTAGQLLASTLKKQQILENLGYSVITIWEDQWNILKQTIKI